MSAQGDARIVLAATLGLACVAMCLVAVTDFHGAREVPVTLTSGWGVRGVAEMASHVNAEKGWNLGADAAEEDTGYLHMFSSPVSQLAKAAAQADNTDCLEHDCPGGGASPAAHHESEEREEAQQEKEEEAQIARQARTMNKFAKLGFAKQHSALVPRAFHPKKKALKHGEHGEHGATGPHFLRAKHVEKMAEKRREQQKALLAAQHTLRMQKPHLPSVGSNSFIRKLEKIAPLPGMPHPMRAHHAPLLGANREVHGPQHALAKGLLARLAARREEQRAKMVEEAAAVAHKKVQDSLKKLI